MWLHQVWEPREETKGKKEGGSEGDPLVSLESTEPDSYPVSQ